MNKLRLLAVVAALTSLTSNAGENKCLGTITVSGASLTNFTTAVPFAIPPGGYLSIYCTAAVRILVDNRVVTTTAGVTKGVPVEAAKLFPTSVGRQDGSVGGSPSAVIAIIGTADCDVWSRSGNE